MHWALHTRSLLNVASPFCVSLSPQTPSVPLTRPTSSLTLSHRFPSVGSTPVCSHILVPVQTGSSPTSLSEPLPRLRERSPCTFLGLSPALASHRSAPDLPLPFVPLLSARLEDLQQPGAQLELPSPDPCTPCKGLDLWLRGRTSAWNPPVGGWGVAYFYTSCLGPHTGEQCVWLNGISPV